MIDNSKICSSLNDLLEANYDAQNGFSNAADESENPRLATFFQNKADQRRRFANEIQNEIKRLGGTFSELGTVIGFMQRAWMDVKTAFTTNNEETILEACETGEKEALGEYDVFLTDTTVPAAVRTMIERQRNEIALSHGQVKNLEEWFNNKL